jgi:zinc protease
VIDEEIAKLAAEGPTSGELERSLAQAEAHFVYRLQTVGGFNGKSDQLNAYNVFIADPGYLDEDWQRYRRLTAADVRTAAAALTPSRRVTLSVVPIGETALAIPGSSRAVVS